MKYLILIILFSLSQCLAFDTENLLHPAAHIGGSYLITHAGQVICMKTTDLNKSTCTIISSAVAIGAGLAIEATQSENIREHAKSMAYNATGVILAIGIIHLDF